MAYVAIMVLLSGCERYFKQQDLLSAGGKCYQGGDVAEVSLVWRRKL